MTLPRILSDEEHAAYRQRYEAYKQWLIERDYKAYKVDEVPESAQISNEERSLLEVYDWHKDPPDQYFIYINDHHATTWTGDVLGYVLFPTYPKRGQQKRAIRIAGTNGVLYVGTYYYGAGDYARIRPAKVQDKTFHQYIVQSVTRRINESVE